MDSTTATTEYAVINRKTGKIMRTLATRKAAQRLAWTYEEFCGVTYSFIVRPISK